MNRLRDIHDISNYFKQVYKHPRNVSRKFLKHPDLVISNVGLISKEFRL